MTDDIEPRYDLSDISDPKFTVGPIDYGGEAKLYLNDVHVGYLYLRGVELKEDLRGDHYVVRMTAQGRTVGDFAHGYKIEAAMSGYGASRDPE